MAFLDRCDERVQQVAIFHYLSVDDLNADRLTRAISCSPPPSRRWCTSRASPSSTGPGTPPASLSCPDWSGYRARGRYASLRIRLRPLDHVHVRSLRLRGHLRSVLCRSQDVRSMKGLHQTSRCRRSRSVGGEERQPLPIRLLDETWSATSLATPTITTAHQGRAAARV